LLEVYITRKRIFVEFVFYLMIDVIYRHLIIRNVSFLVSKDFHMKWIT